MQAMYVQYDFITFIILIIYSLVALLYSCFVFLMISIISELFCRHDGKSLPAQSND